MSEGRLIPQTIRHKNKQDSNGRTLQVEHATPSRGVDVVNAAAVSVENQSGGTVDVDMIHVQFPSDSDITDAFVSHTFRENDIFDGDAEQRVGHELALPAGYVIAPDTTLQLTAVVQSQDDVFLEITLIVLRHHLGDQTPQRS